MNKSWQSHKHIISKVRYTLLARTPRYLVLLFLTFYVLFLEENPLDNLWDPMKSNARPAHIQTKKLENVLKKIRQCFGAVSYK